MSRFLLIALIVILLVLAILFILQPQVLDGIWMWLVGFAGYVVLLFRRASEGLKSLFTKSESPAKTADPVQAPAQPTPLITPQLSNDTLDELNEKVRALENQLLNAQKSGLPMASHAVTVLRYLDDGQTTLGLIFLKNRFFAYTLEDTHRDSKVHGKTRIPEGTYPLELNRVETPLTQRYRNRFPWFDYHIEIMKIPNFSRVYIHIGNTHADTEGCILIADGVNAADPQKMITHSRLAFERFYKTLHPLLNQGKQLSIQVLNEDWFSRSHLLQKTEAIAME
ncbi:MAG: hypothetical protein JJU34_13015 [Lunatimonas sp.]|uniref:DUF5675 family protein n=1 Tax=Lunatimonas sp. TaxID=2060141 RepID=UPI00263BA147|nr:DUF5675 family protein [Lunatimonas sp.]MCC5938193.1 hypothetical protein [Lunatimonas sp.]